VPGVSVVSINGSGAAAATCGGGVWEGRGEQKGTKDLLGLAASDSGYILRYLGLHSWAVIYWATQRVVGVEGKQGRGTMDHPRPRHPRWG
jgi:hypothetical protein